MWHMIIITVISLLSLLHVGVLIHYVHEWHDNFRMNFNDGKLNLCM